MDEIIEVDMTNPTKTGVVRDALTYTLRRFTAGLGRLDQEIDNMTGRLADLRTERTSLAFRSLAIQEHLAQLDKGAE